MVAGGQVLHPFPHALHHSELSVIGGKASCIRSPSIGLHIRSTVLFSSALKVLIHRMFGHTYRVLNIY
jgi:hypothetical protein